MGETPKEYDDYEAASKASCAWVDKGKAKIDPKKLVLYYSRLKKSPAYEKVVGLGYKTANDVVTPYVRLDMDVSGKGIHFNAVNLSDSEDKLAATLKKTVHMEEKSLTQLYMEYIKALENRSAEFIWNWWKNGIAGQLQ